MSCACSMTGHAGSYVTGINGLLPTIVWPSDVEAKKVEIDPGFENLELMADTCDKLSAEDAISVNRFLGAWRAFRDEPTPTFGSANKWDEALRYQDRLRDYQDMLEAKGCDLIGAKVTRPAPEATIPDYFDTVKTIAVASAVIAGSTPRRW